MKNIIFVILVFSIQISFAQDVFSENIKHANKNMENGLDRSDESFNELLEYLETINDSIYCGLEHYLQSKTELIYYVHKFSAPTYTYALPKYSGFIKDIETNEVFTFKYISYDNKNYKLSINEMSTDNPNSEYYSFLIANYSSNAKGIFSKINHYKKQYKDLSVKKLLGGIEDYEFLYILNSKKNEYKGYSFVLSHLIFLDKEIEQFEKF
ncbi:hypothetical protein [Paenimyroides aestuarii]|uniref:Uncharacterized protein n=1 Tax=Paenimyroides aestuarii TaxID=2968490 RepID=A0ABY5NPS1_9FLAO|nr:hypothetical protein [Paenimyroides aestuarii]UUV20516.1 hypothetical protein NPX36_09080 [Paenimyroides aestuarii]